MTWYLRPRRRADRRSVSLGTIDEDAARLYLAALNAIEEDGCGDTWRAWHDRSRGGALAALLSEDPIAAVRDAGTDWGGATLRRYHREIYAPWRSEKRPASWKAERAAWNRILRELGDVRVRDVDPWLVADMLDEARVERGRRRGQPLAGNSKRLLRAALQALLKRACRLRHIDAIPDLAMFTIEGASKVRRRREPLTVEEVRALFAASDTHYRALWAVQAGNGLRPSEAVRVRWEDIDWKTPALRVRGTKTDAAAAVIPLTPLALRPLVAWAEACGRPETGHVFGHDGKPYTSESPFKRALRTAARRADIQRKITPYMLRHTFATLAWASGIPEDVARRIMRHTDSKMLREVYQNPTPAQLAEKVAGFTL